MHVFFSQLSMMFYFKSVVPFFNSERGNFTPQPLMPDKSETAAPVHGLRRVSQWEIHPQNKAISGRSHTWSQFPELNQFKMNSLCLPNWKRDVRRCSLCESRIR